MLDPVQFKEIYSRYRCSGLTVRDFCRNEGLAEARFYYWQHKLKTSLPDKRGFVPLIISPSDPSMVLRPNSREKSCELPPDAHYEIIYPNGIRLQQKGLPGHELLRLLFHLNH